jgi:hypothetical protein
MWHKMALTTAVALSVAGCASGAGGTASQASAPAPAVTPQSGQSSIFGASASDYTLVSINGHALPYAAPAKGDASLQSMEVVSGTLDLAANGEFSISTRYRDATAPGGHDVDNKFSGSCTPEGHGYHMFWDGGGDSQLEISGDSVTVDDGGVHSRYVKQH